MFFIINFSFRYINFVNLTPKANTLTNIKQVNNEKIYFWMKIMNPNNLRHPLQDSTNFFQHYNTFGAKS